MKNINKEEFYKNHDREIQKILSKKTIGIIGAGGIGSNAAVALARSGVGKLIIADFDKIELTNLNRQYYFIEQVGMIKADALKANLQKINPFIDYDFHNVKVDENNLNIFQDVDILLEAVDKADEKVNILYHWQILYPDIPIIMSSGIAGMGENDKIHCRKVDNTIYVCGDENKSIKDYRPYAPKVAIVANLMANLALEILIG